MIKIHRLIADTNRFVRFGVSRGLKNAQEQLLIGCWASGLPILQTEA
jgi:hypothetical protein